MLSVDLNDNFSCQEFDGYYAIVQSKAVEKTQ